MNCEHCGLPATEKVAGEADSFGQEWLELCQACAKQAEKAEEEYLLALDVPDRASPAGYTFVVDEGYNYDDGGLGFFRVTTSYRAAVSYLRRCEKRAERRGGLYPNKGVQEITTEEANARRRRQAAALRELVEETFG